MKQRENWADFLGRKGQEMQEKMRETFSRSVTGPAHTPDFVQNTAADNNASWMNRSAPSIKHS